MNRLLAGLACAALALALFPALAAAHAELVQSTPADGAQIALTDAPKTVAITFSEEVGKDITTVHVTAADGTDVTAGPAQVDFDNGKLVTTPLKALNPGSYTVQWHAVTADDNGLTDGTFHFTIVNNTGGTTSGGTTSGGSTNTLPHSGVPLALPGAAALATLAALLFGAGLGLRRWARPQRF